MRVLLVKIYAFLISFEHILEFYFGIETILKPYRVIGIFIVLLGMKSLAHSPQIKLNKRLIYYLLFVVVHIIFVAIIGEVNWAGFNNYYIQVFFNAVVFMTIISFSWNEENYVSVIKFYVCGVVINSLFIIYTKHILNFTERLSGFVDDPNSASFGITLAFIFLLYFRLNKKLSLLVFVTLSTVLMFALYYTGSRSGIFLVTLSVFTLLLLTKVNFQSLSIIGIGIFVVYKLVFMVLEPDDKNYHTANSTVSRFEKIDSDIRFDLWQSGYVAFENSMYFGVGMFQFASNFKIFGEAVRTVNKSFYKARKKMYKGLSLHNLYFEVLFGTGFLGFFFFLRFIYQIIRLSKFKERTNLNRKLHYSMCICFLVFIAVVDAILSGYFWFTLFIISNSFVISNIGIKNSVLRTKRLIINE